MMVSKLRSKAKEASEWVSSKAGIEAQEEATRQSAEVLKRLREEQRVAPKALLARITILIAVLLFSMGASYRTPNFTIQTQSPQLAEEFGKSAEKHRHDLAVLWLGHALPQWNQPCPVTVRVGPGLGAGGATTFVFNKGEVFGWRMTIQGSRLRVLDSVLPHEITHMILASHFRQPLPRWADEGAANSVEDKTERDKRRKMLLQYLTSGRGIAFNRMFAMTEYPADIMPLHAQGLALCEFLVQQGGRRGFVKYLEDGLETDKWVAATKDHYGYRNLGELQNDWVAWVGNGFPGSKPAGSGTAAVRGDGLRTAGGQVVVSGYG